MKSLAQILHRVCCALEFANVENLREFNDLLDRHAAGSSQPFPDPCRAGADGRQTRACNVYYLSHSLPAR